jgi:hypothetical protein
LGEDLATFPGLPHKPLFNCPLDSPPIHRWESSELRLAHVVINFITKMNLEKQAYRINSLRKQTITMPGAIHIQDGLKKEGP